VTVEDGTHTDGSEEHVARPEVPAPAPNAIFGVLLRLNALDRADVKPSLNASCERLLRARSAGGDVGDALEELAANSLLELEQIRAAERHSSTSLALAA
jgi:hypothetical protein